ncbi:neprosin family prolyl endopeptidase [Kitasatospora sp. NPDC058965]|uniref:neprosin family prolyl endopeptidase n=1 Tax=Kitasatospora sp. NPDC058965 TaxID=3346682 RepID=UPI0036AA5249
MRISRTLVGCALVLGLLGAAPGTATAAPAPAPAPASAAAAGPAGPICWFGACFDYVTGRQNTDAAGASIRMLQSAPAVKPGDTSSHSLQELAVQSADQKSTVEIGWTVDLGLNGDTRPHLFVYHWVDGQESCYNGCGFVQVSRTVRPGTALARGEAGSFAIDNLGGDWWVFYDGTAVGYFPGSLWNGGYTRAQMISAFGEVAHADGSTCEGMGDGRFGTAPGAGWISGFRLFDSADAPQLTVTATSPALYDAGAVTATSFHLGGPGSGPGLPGARLRGGARW